MPVEQFLAHLHCTKEEADKQTLRPSNTCLLFSGTAEPVGLGGFSPPTFEEDDIFFVLFYMRVFAR